MNAQRILIVDSHRLSRKYLVILLASAGYQNVATAEDADQARQLIYRDLPRLTLLDVRMRASSGFMLVRDLRADVATRDMAIIGISADARDMIRVAALDAGCDAYFTKPIDGNALLTEIARILGDP